MKTKTITLTGPLAVLDAQGDHYRILKVTDTIEFGAKRFLDAKTVRELCDAEDWKVTSFEQVR